MKLMNTVLQNRAGGTAFNRSEDNTLLRHEKSELGFVWMLWVCWRGVVDWKMEQQKRLVFYTSSEVLGYFYGSFFSECALISHNALWRWWVVGILSVSACGTYKDYLSPSSFFWHHTYVHTNDPQDKATLGASAQFSPTVPSRCFFYACTSTLIGAVMAVTYLLYISANHEFKTDTSSTHDHDIFHTHSGWISQRSQQSRYN